MSERIVTRQPVVTQEDLLRQGFTPEQIRRLIDIGDQYPLIELFISQKARDRLVFLRWCYQSGRISR